MQSAARSALPPEGRMSTSDGSGHSGGEPRTAEASPKMKRLSSKHSKLGRSSNGGKQGETPRVMPARPSRSSANNSPLRPGAGTLGVDSRPSPGFWNGWPVRVAAISLLVMGLAAWFSWQTTGRKPEEVVDRLKPSLPEGISRVPPSEAWPTQTAIVPETIRAHSHEPKTSQRVARKVALQTARSQNSVKHSDSNEVEEYAALDQTEIATDFCLSVMRIQLVVSGRRTARTGSVASDDAALFRLSDE